MPANPASLAASGVFTGADIVAVTTSDTVADPNGPFRAITFSGAGVIVLVTLTGATRTIPSGQLSTNTIHPIGFSRVNSTSTTATGIMGIV